MPMTTSIIEAAMAYNASHPTQTQADAATRLAQAVIDTVKQMDIAYISGLVGVAPGTPIAGATLVKTIT